MCIRDSLRINNLLNGCTVEESGCRRSRWTVASPRAERRSRTPPGLPWMRCSRRSTPSWPVGTRASRARASPCTPSTSRPMSSTPTPCGPGAGRHWRRSTPMRPPRRSSPLPSGFRRTSCSPTSTPGCAPSWSASRSRTCGSTSRTATARVRTRRRTRPPSALPAWCPPPLRTARRRRTSVSGSSAWRRRSATGESALWSSSWPPCSRRVACPKAWSSHCPRSPTSSRSRRW